MKTPCLLSVALALTNAAAARAQVPTPATPLAAPPRVVAAPPPNVAPPRLAVALSGGGARGIAHVGALRALEEAGIPVEAIAANSMGAIVGAVYATGQDAAGLEKIVRSMDWESLFSGRPDRRILPLSRRVDRYRSFVGVSFDFKSMKFPAGLLAEHRVNRFLIENLAPAGYAAAGDFDKLPIPFRAVATDLATGDVVVLAKGDLARAARASMSIPLVFPPVEWEGRSLVDGLVANNLPIDVARTYSPRVLVAIDIGSPPMQPEDYASAIGIATQVNDILTRRRYRDFAAEADVLIRPDLGKHSAADYSGFDDLIEKGYEATKAAIPEIRRKLEAAGVTDLAPHPKPARRTLEGAPIREIVVRGNDRVSDTLVRNTFNVPVGPPFSMEKGLRAFDKVDATNLLARTWMEFEPSGDGVRVVLRVKDAPAMRAEAGVGFTEWERARACVRLRNNNLFGFGEEIEALAAASDAEARGELSLRGEKLIFKGVGYRVRGFAVQDKPRFFDGDGDEINRASFDRLGFDAALRGAPRRWIQIEAGYRFGHVDVNQEPGLAIPGGRDKVSAVFGSATYDTLDDLEWPEHGLRLAAYGEWSPEGLGGDREYWSAWFDGRASVPLAKDLDLQIDGLAGLSGRDLPVYDWYRVGGPWLIPGYRHEELKGAQTIAAAMSLRYRLVGKLRLVARAGTGNVFDLNENVTLDGLRWGVAAGAMYPSPIGPVSVEVGVRNGGKTIVTLNVGWP